MYVVSRRKKALQCNTLPWDKKTKTLNCTIIRRDFPIFFSHPKARLSYILYSAEKTDVRRYIVHELDGFFESVKMSRIQVLGTRVTPLSKRDMGYVSCTGRISLMSRSTSPPHFLMISALVFVPIFLEKVLNGISTYDL